MERLLALLIEHGPLLVFVNVLIEQLGAPIPAVPLLVVAGALSMEADFSALNVLLLAVLASGMANFVWYLAGRRYGRRVLGLVCKVTLSPDVCVRQTENVFARWGVAALLVARFVPGLSAVAAPLAGATGLKAGRFVFFDTLGTTLWAGLAVGAGMLLHRQVDALLDALGELGGGALLVLVALLALYVALRWIERARLLRFVRARRIGTDELRALIEAGNAPVIVDVRSAAAREADPRRIPGAVEAELADVARVLAQVPAEREIVLYCACPNEASAAKATRVLLRHGYKRVRPLAGGLDGWIAQAGARAPHEPA